jgi:hypothetical protein
MDNHSKVETPKEFAAFRTLLRQVVKPEPKPASAPVPSGKGQKASEAFLPVNSAYVSLRPTMSLSTALNRAASV